MFLKNIISPLHLDRISETIKRFPLSLICMLGLFFLMVEIDELFLAKESIFYQGREHLIGVLLCGFFAFGGVRLMSEQMGWTRFREYLVAVLIIAALAFTFVLQARMYYFIMLAPLVVLFVTTAPFINRRHDDDHAFWLYNYRIWLGAAFAGVAAIVLGSGLQSAVYAIQFLFEVEIPPKLYIYILSFVSTIFFPLYALSFVPRDFGSDPAETEKPRPVLSFILSWLVAPLAIINFITFYLYAIKIASQMALPKGELVYMVVAFGLTGVIIYLAGHPLRERGTVLLRFLYNHFFKILILPVFLLAIAIGIRLSEYGVTENRYMVTLALIWFALLCGFYSFGRRPIKWMPLSLMALLAIALVGPWGAVPLSGYNQTHILKNLLEKNNLLADGKILFSKEKKVIPSEDNGRISSILDYLYSSKRDKNLEGLLPDGVRYGRAEDAVKAMGLEYMLAYNGAAVASPTICKGIYTENEMVDIRGYSYYQKGTINSQPNTATQTPSIPANVSFAREENDIVITVKEKGSLRFALSEIMRANPDVLWSSSNFQDLEKPMTVTAKEGGLRGKLIISRLCIIPEWAERPAVLDSADFTLLLDY